MTILGIHHTGIATRDIERLSRFYIETLGAVKLEDSAWANSPDSDAVVGLKDSAARFIFLRLVNYGLELFEYKHPIGSSPNLSRLPCDAGITHLCLAVDDIDYEYARLSGAGMRFNTSPKGGPDAPLRSTYGRDPDGNIIELIEITGKTNFDYTPEEGTRWLVPGKEQTKVQG